MAEDPRTIEQRITAIEQIVSARTLALETVVSEALVMIARSKPGMREVILDELSNAAEGHRRVNENVVADAIEEIREDFLRHPRNVRATETD